MDDRLVPYAPTVIEEAWAERPDVAGRYDPERRAVVVNTARQPPLTPTQRTGLIALERARGFFYSPLGEPWVDNYPLTEEQRTFWDPFYLPPTVDAPQDRTGRDRILKSTLFSRGFVGDTLPPGSPPFTPEQEQMAALFRAYARGTPRERVVDAMMQREAKP